MVKKLTPYFLKIFCLGCLMFLVAVPAQTQEQSTKGQTPPPGGPPPGIGKPQPQPAPAPAPVPKEYKADSVRARQLPDEALEKKQVSGKVGGQEIRAKQGEEDK